MRRHREELCAGAHKAAAVRKVCPSNVYVTAYTDIAARPLQGTTLHSFAGLPDVENKTNEEVVAIFFGNEDEEAIRRWRRAHALIIDEISLVDGHFFDQLEHLSRAVRGRSEPFGGLQLIVSGDFLQLPPVDRVGNRVYAFEAQSWNYCFHLQIQLTQVLLNRLSGLRLSERFRGGQVIFLKNSRREGVRTAVIVSGSSGMVVDFSTEGRPADCEEINAFFDCQRMCLGGAWPISL